jgi:hypothetical protein
VLDWGINAATRLAETDVAKRIQPDNPALKVQACRRPESVLLRVTNTSDQPLAGKLALDLKSLDIHVRKVWAEFAGAVSMDGEAVENREDAEQKRYAGISYDAHVAELYYRLGKGQTRVFGLGRY